MSATRSSRALVSGDRAVPWRHRILPGWPIVPTKVVTRINREVLPEGTDPSRIIRYVDISSVNSTGIIRVESLEFGKAPSRARRVARRGDTIVSTVRTYLQAVATIPPDDSDLIVSTDFAVVTPRQDRVLSRFASFWLRSVLFVDEVCARSTGVSYPAVNSSEIGVLPFPAPPLATQRAIAEFLDKRTAAIDALIAKKERLIALLQERRQALITQAVTKGIDPNVPMKDSGVEWLGEIPAHWRVLPIKRLARRGAKTFTDGDWIEAPYITDDGVRLLQTGNVGIGVFKEQGFRYVSEETFHALRCTPVDPGDVMICRLDGPVGRACLAPDLGCKVITSVDNAILKPSAEHDARYLVYCLSLPRYLAWVQVLCRVGGGFRFRVSRSMLGDFRMPTPSRSEQEAIADQLDRTTEASIRVERTLKASAERLREYRQALITEAVTGKLDIAQEVVRDPEAVRAEALEATP